MFCRIYCCSTTTNRICVIMTLLAMLCSAAILLLAAVLSLGVGGKAKLFNRYSNFLNGDMAGMTFWLGLVLGVLTIVMSAFGCLLVSPKYKKRWMQWVFGCVGFFTFTFLIALGLTIYMAGLMAANAIQ